MDSRKYNSDIFPILIGVCFIAFLLIGCASHSSRDSSTSYEKDCIQLASKLLLDNFPRGILLDSPYVSISKGDTLKINILQKWGIYHTVNSYEIASRIFHILNSAKCKSLRKYSINGNVHITIYYRIREKGRSGDFVISNYKQMLSLWENPNYAKFNTYMISIDPENFVQFDNIIKDYYKTYHAPLFEAKFNNLYSAMISDEPPNVYEKMLMDSVVAGVYRHSDILDTNIVDILDYYLKYGKINLGDELIIKDQIPDSLKVPAK